MRNPSSPALSQPVVKLPPVFEVVCENSSTKSSPASSHVETSSPSGHPASSTSSSSCFYCFYCLLLLAAGMANIVAALKQHSPALAATSQLSSSSSSTILPMKTAQDLEAWEKLDDVIMVRRSLNIFAVGYMMDLLLFIQIIVRSLMGFHMCLFSSTPACVALLAWSQHPTQPPWTASGHAVTADTFCSCQLHISRDKCAVSPSCFFSWLSLYLLRPHHIAWESATCLVMAYEYTSPHKSTLSIAHELSRKCC